MKKVQGVKASGAEQDAHSRRWRHRLVWTRGELRKIKRQTRRKARRAGKRLLREES